MSMTWQDLSSLAATQRADEKRASSSRVLAVLIVLVGVLDIISTNASLSVGNIEGNPVMRMAQDYLGVYWVVPKLLVHLFVGWLLLWLPTKRMILFSRIAIALYAVIILMNFSFAGMAL